LPWHQISILGHNFGTIKSTVDIPKFVHMAMTLDMKLCPHKDQGKSGDEFATTFQFRIGNIKLRRQASARPYSLIGNRLRHQVCPPK
jgi:hypothetical protein